MKTYKCFLLILATVVLAACSGSSEDELIGNWVKVGDFGGARRGFASYFTIGNVGYVVAGYNGYQPLRRDMWKVEVGTNGVGSWTNTTDSLPKGMERRSAVGFSVNGKGYIGTGWDNLEKIMNDFWEYDPSKSGTGNAWRQVASLPVAAQARYDAISFVLNGVAYVGTGYTAGADQSCLLDFWKFIPPSDALPNGGWEQVTSIGGSKRSGAVVFVINNVAYVCTGSNIGSTTSGNIYDFWSFDGTNWKKLRNINNSDIDNDYDDEYTSIARVHGVGFTLNGKGYVAVGNMAQTWEYEPPVYSESGELISGDLWTQKTSFNPSGSAAPRQGAVILEFPAGTATDHDMVFVGTGLYGSSYVEDMWNFYPDDEDNVYD